MTVTLDLALVGQILAIIVALGAIYAYAQQRRTLIMAQGKQAQTIEEMYAKIKSQERQISDLKEKAACTDREMTEVRGDLKYLVKTVGEMKETLDRIAPPTVKQEDGK